jgi:hypothetical protein
MHPPTPSHKNKYIYNKMLFFPETILKTPRTRRFLLTGQKHLMERFILSMLSSKNSTALVFVRL